MPAPRPRRPRDRRGFSLIEIMIALTLLGIVLMSLAQFSVFVSRRSNTNGIGATRNAVLQLEANKFGAMRYDSLLVFPTTAKTFTVSGFRYTRRLAISGTTGNRRSVKIVVVPARDTTQKDSLTIWRSKPSGSPLCVGC